MSEETQEVEQEQVDGDFLADAAEEISGGLVDQEEADAGGIAGNEVLEDLFGEGVIPEVQEEKEVEASSEEDKVDEEEAEETEEEKLSPRGEKRFQKLANEAREAKEQAEILQAQMSQQQQAWQQQQAQWQAYAQQQQQAQVQSQQAYQQQQAEIQQRLEANERAKRYEEMSEIERFKYDLMSEQKKEFETLIQKSQEPLLKEIEAAKQARAQAQAAAKKQQMYQKWDNESTTVAKNVLAKYGDDAAPLLEDVKEMAINLSAAYGYNSALQAEQKLGALLDKLYVSRHTAETRKMKAARDKNNNAPRAGTRSTTGVGTAVKTGQVDVRTLHYHGYENHFDWRMDGAKHLTPPPADWEE